MSICLYTYLFSFLAVENNEIQDNANNNIDKNEMTCEHNNNNNDKNSQINNRYNEMVYINDQRQLLSSIIFNSTC